MIIELGLDQELTDVQETSYNAENILDQKEILAKYRSELIKLFWEEDHDKIETLDR